MLCQVLLSALIVDWRSKAWGTDALCAVIAGHRAASSARPCTSPELSLARELS